MDLLNKHILPTNRFPDCEISESGVPFCLFRVSLLCINYQDIMIVEEPPQVLDSCRTLIRGVVDQYKAVFCKQ